MVLARNVVVRKQSWALNKFIGKHSYGCGIMGIVLWNSEVTGALVVEGWISVVRRQVISRMKGVRMDQKVSHNVGQRSTILFFSITEVHLCTAFIAMRMDSIA